MKRIFLYVLTIACLSLGAHSSAQSTPLSKVVFGWSYAYTGTYPVCTSSVTTNCITSFRINEGSTVIATIPATSATTYGYTLTPLPAAGTHTYQVVATAIYSSGTIDSAPATVSLQVPSIPTTPGNFTGSVQ